MKVPRGTLINYQNIDTPIGPPDIVVPRRNIIFTWKDVLAYLELVEAECPHLGLITEYKVKIQDSPSLDIKRLEELEPAMRLDVYLSTENLDIKWERHRDYLVNGNIPYPNGAIFSRGVEVYDYDHVSDTTYPYDIEKQTGGHIFFRAVKSDPDSVRFVRYLIRLIGKVATNKAQWVDVPSMQVVSRMEKGGTTWIGHDAIRWAREHPHRILSQGERPSMALRPLDD